MSTGEEIGDVLELHAAIEEIGDVLELHAAIEACLTATSPTCYAVSAGVRC